MVKRESLLLINFDFFPKNKLTYSFSLLNNQGDFCSVRLFHVVITFHLLLLLLLVLIPMNCVCVCVGEWVEGEIFIIRRIVCLSRIRTHERNFNLLVLPHYPCAINIVSSCPIISSLFVPAAISLANGFMREKNY
jgi:hypothetical protein